MNKERLQRRYQECEILCRPLERQASEFSVSDMEQPDKRAIRQALRFLCCHNIDYTAPKEHSFFLTSFSYEYHRFDCDLSVSHLSHVVPCTDDIMIASKTMFVNCGSGAVMSLLTALYSFRTFSVQYAHDIYFESHQILEMLNCDTGTPVYYVDSIQLTPEESLERVCTMPGREIVILDTSCWNYEESQAAVKRVLKQGHICIVVKSMSKLEMLGTEFSKLGAITYYFPKSLPKDKLEMMKQIVARHKEMIGHMGIWADPGAIPVFWADPAFRAVTDARTAAIRKSNSYGAELLQKQYDMVMVPAHRLFLLLRLRKDLPVVPIDIKRRLRVMLEQNNALGVPFRMASGFGFDETVVDMYFDNCTQSNQIRVAFGDEEPEQIEKITECLAAFLREIAVG
ncbi:MAG: hypothetical protein MJ071_03010 [Oscillospiraceae bacterium]|nr:hypothetical protein [Oscillospiraceae bacterium]